MKSYKLLAEIVDPKDLKAHVLEEANSMGEIAKSYYISGPFIVSEIRNKNNRIYKRPVIEREVASFTNDKIRNNRAGGELNHPDSPVINLDRISHYITELRNNGNVWVGKAKLATTPVGMVAQCLLNDGFQFGVSTRGLGDVADDGEVSDDFKLITIDLVSDPSAPDAWVNGVYENKEWLVNENGAVFEAPVKQLNKKFSRIPKKDAERYLVEAVKDFIKSLK